MRFLSVLPLALGASSFLIPPQVADSKVVLQEIPSTTTKSDRITFQCDGGCPLFINGELQKGFSREKASLMADIKAEDERVLFNGQQIWPATNPPAALSIKQKLRPFRGYRRYLDPMPISTSVEYKPQEFIVDEQNSITIQPITIEILAVANEVVHAETVEIRVSESSAGLSLLPSRITPYQPSPLTDSCTNVWCRVQGTVARKYREWRAAAGKKVHGWRGCGGKKRPQMAGGHIVKGGPNKFGPGSTLHPHHGHAHHHGHHHHGGHFARFLRGFVRVMIPPFVGMSIGLLIGTLIKIVVLRLQRRRALAHGGYVQVKQTEDVEARVSMEGPPKYEQVYSEIASEKIDEKKDMQ